MGCHPPGGVGGILRVSRFVCVRYGDGVVVKYWNETGYAQNTCYQLDGGLLAALGSH
jgi:hypothetical protein